jgi:thiosulfate/3-mercaptopyruvate sulfurtransferase
MSVTALPGPLVSPEWLADRLDDPGIRVFDCTVEIVRPDGGSEWAFDTEGPRLRWATGHVPGASFADLVELSIHDEEEWMMLPESHELAARAAAIGIGEGLDVVLYDAGFNIWAARLRWMLKTIGFDRASVLDGGWLAWQSAGLPTSAGAAVHPPAALEARSRPELVASTEDVVRSLDTGDIALLNAVGEEQHHGRGPFHAGRPGHIPSSVNVPYDLIVDPETHRYLTPENLVDFFAAKGVDVAGGTIVYCGAAIAACSAALALELLGADDVVVYDGSIREWSRDPARELIVD